MMKLLDLDCKLFKIYFSIYNSPIKKWVKKSSFLKGLLLSTLVVNNCFGVVCMRSARGLSSEERLNFLRLHVFQLFTVPSIADFSKECCLWQALLVAGLNLLLQYVMVSGKGEGFLHLFCC